MVQFEIRASTPHDEEQLLSLAGHLDTVNLPDDRESIREILAHSYGSFTGTIHEPRERQYVFVLVDRTCDRIVGTSMIIAQLGRRAAPYIYFDVLDEEKYSASVDKHFHHTVLQIGYSYSGPTELGGLIVLPEYRKDPERLGLLISYVRFLYLAMRREVFQKQVLAELLPPLGEDGTSHLWEAIGRRFTGMTYAEADFLSKKNKEFIKALFPDGVVYASLLSREAQAVIGKVGSQTRGVERMLRRIGFRYADRVDPFDGGPHFTADMDEISLVKRSRRAIVDRSFTQQPGDARALVGIELAEAPFFRVITAHIRDFAERGLAVSETCWEYFGLHRGSEVVLLPLD